MRNTTKDDVTADNKNIRNQIAEFKTNPTPELAQELQTMVNELPKYVKSGISGGAKQGFEKTKQLLINAKELLKEYKDKRKTSKMPKYPSDTSDYSQVRPKKGEYRKRPRSNAQKAHNAKVLNYLRSS